MIIFISFQVRYTVFINSSSFDSRLMASQLGPVLSVRPSISASVGIVINIMNYRFLTTETNYKAFYIFRCFLTQPHQ